MIKNGKNSGLSIVSSGLPDMSSTLDSWLVKLKLYIVSTTLDNYETIETKQEVSFFGTWQPMSIAQIDRKPERWREFHWYMLHTKTNINLKFKDVVVYKGKQYKVLTVGPYEDYGYYYYELIEDYDGIGPYDEEETP